MLAPHLSLQVCRPPHHTTPHHTTPHTDTDCTVGCGRLYAVFRCKQVKVLDFRRVKDKVRLSSSVWGRMVRSLALAAADGRVLVAALAMR
jgi:hypothetical protein